MAHVERLQDRAAAHLSAGITAAEPVAGIVPGMVVFGDSIRVSPGLILLGASGLIALIIGVILVARSLALQRRHRSRV